MLDTQLMKLKRVLDSNHIDRSMYSLNGYADERVCLEKFGDGWDIYIGERGMKYAYFPAFQISISGLFPQNEYKANGTREAHSRVL